MKRESFGVSQNMSSKMLSEKLIVSKGECVYDGKVFVLFNTNQYKFTDIRNETYQKSFEYIEE